MTTQNSGATHPTTAFQETRDGFEVRGLRSEQVEVRIVPALGARIASLVDRRTGREWMWSPPAARLFANELHDDFTTSTIIGADECIPTIAACQWRGRQLPDHGEAWSQPWEPLDEAGAITTRLRLPVSPFEFTRRIALQGNRLQLRYTLKNLSDGPEEYVWALHPLLTLQEGDELRLPETCRTVRTHAAVNCNLGERGDKWPWPQPRPGIDLSRLDLGAPNASYKLFTEPLSEGYAAVVNAQTGDALTFHFDVAELDTIGLWINRGAWNGYQHFAIEPTNGAPDELDVAVRDWKRCGTLAPGEVRDWWLDIVVGQEKAGLS